MSKQNSRVHSALKHGGYSGTTLLPGEDRDAFEKLHRDLIAEFAPAGPAEEDIILTMARLLWRKQNLSTYKVVELVKNRWLVIRAKYGPRYDPNSPDIISLSSFERKDLRSQDEIRADEKAAEQELRNELGGAMAFVEMGDAITIERLFENLSVIDRLDGMFDRRLKRLLMVRGVKSLSQTATAAPAAIPQATYCC